LFVGCTTVERGVSQGWGCNVEVRTFLPLITVWGECQPWFWSMGLSDTSFSVAYAGEQASAACKEGEVYIEDVVATRDELPLYWIFGKRTFISRGRFVNLGYNGGVSNFRGKDVRKRRRRSSDVHDKTD